MSWESRAGCAGGPYYTRTVRRPGGKRARDYYGKGPIGELAWVIDALRRVEAEQARRAAAAARGENGTATG
jgi:hypothetical protein